jgi:crotonobetainyl-CoA:carnitine CoA-transferase CaiB-like acyl-CoA transferase
MAREVIVTQTISGKEEALLSYCRVLDLTGEKGLLCGKILGDLGADVIKIERPGGDPARNIGPFYHDIPDPEKSLFWFAFNTNKRGITLNIESSDGRVIFKRLVKISHFVIESFEPGYMAGLGLSYATLSEVNPRLVMISITPFGQTGPYAHHRASDIVVHAMGYLMNQCGDPDRAPVQVSFPQSFVSTGTDGAVGAMVAHYHRELTGKGQHVDVSAMESVVYNALEGIPEWTVGGSDFKRRGSLQKMARRLFSPVIWECKDGYMSYFFMAGIHGAKANQGIVDWMGSKGMAPQSLKEMDWVKLDAEKMTQEELDAIHEPMAKFFKTCTRTEIQEESIKRLIMMYPIYDSKETMENPQLRARDFWVEIRHDELDDTITYPGAFAKFSETPIKNWRRAPLIGEHNDEIYGRELGFSKDEMVMLKEAGVI